MHKQVKIIDVFGAGRAGLIIGVVSGNRVDNETRKYINGPDNDDSLKKVNRDIQRYAEEMGIENYPTIGNSVDLCLIWRCVRNPERFGRDHRVHYFD